MKNTFDALFGNENVLEFAEAENLAFEIIQYSQNLVLVNLRFLDAAYFQLMPRPSDQFSLATDGAFLHFKPEYVLSTFSKDPNQIARDILHSVLHCVFRHLFVGRVIQIAPWDLACDIAVEAQIEELGLPATSSTRAYEQKVALETLRSELSALSAQKLYRFFVDSDMTEDEMSTLRNLFYADDHSLWYHQEVQPQPPTDESELSDDPGKGEPIESDDDDDSSLDDLDGEDQKQPETSEDAGDTEEEQESTDDEEDEDVDTPASADAPADETGSMSSDGVSDSDGSSDSDNETESENSSDSEGESEETAEAESDLQGDGSSGDSERESDKEMDDHGESDNPDREDPLEATWEKISERMEVDLETLSRGQSENASGLVRTLKSLNREKYDYESFLRRFAVMGETMQVNDDEFDYIYYTYGLKLYDNMPLIEPLEYKESHRVREFVIAIDTSASTSGKLVESFITKTYNMLMATENFFTRVNIHIIQADMQVQHVAKITNAEEFSKYTDDLKIYGIGGTDFRPVFEYVDERIKEGEFANLGGLIYFTDGMGTFPEHQPSYKTAFVFLDDEATEPSVPIWAIKLVMESEDL